LESVQLAARFPDFREALSGRHLRDKLSQLIAVLARKCGIVENINFGSDLFRNRYII